MINLTWYFSLVLLSLLPVLTPFPRQRSSQHSNLVLPSACIPPRRLRQASLVSILLLYPSNNPSIFLLFIPWDKLPQGLLGHHDCFSNVEQKQKNKIYRALDYSSYIPVTPLTSVTLSISQ